MSVKIYNKEQKKWVVFPGTVGAPGKDAYIIAVENGYTGTREEFNSTLMKVVNFNVDEELEPLKEELSELRNFVYSKHLNVSASISGSNFKVGNTATITVSGVLKLDSDIKVGKYILYKNNAVIDEYEGETYSYSTTTNETATFKLEILFNGSIVYTTSKAVEARYSIYTKAFHESQDINNLNVIELVDKGIAKPVNIIYDALTEGDKTGYIYFCIPSVYGNSVTAFLDAQSQSPLPLTAVDKVVTINNVDVSYKIYYTNQISIDKQITVYYK